MTAYPDPQARAGANERAELTQRCERAAAELQTLRGELEGLRAATSAEGVGAAAQEAATRMAEMHGESYIGSV